MPKQSKHLAVRERKGRLSSHEKKLVHPVSTVKTRHRWVMLVGNDTNGDRVGLRAGEAPRKGFLEVQPPPQGLSEQSLLTMSGFCCGAGYLKLLSGDSKKTPPN